MQVNLVKTNALHALNMLEIPTTSRKQKGISSLIFTVLFLSSISMYAQHYTYIGGGMNLLSANPVSDFGPYDVSNIFMIDGGGYDVTIRQEISNLISIETGLSAHNYGQEFLIDGNYIWTGGFWSHRIPLKLEFEVDLYMDRIKGYASFGTLICIAGSYASGQRLEYLESETLSVISVYNEDKLLYTMYNVGTGLRFRIVDQLLFELEVGYTFRTKDLITSYMTRTTEPGETNEFLHHDKANFWYVQGGISYPVQRIVDGIRWVKDQLEN